MHFAIGGSLIFSFQIPDQFEFFLDTCLSLLCEPYLVKGYGNDDFDKLTQASGQPEDSRTLDIKLLSKFC
jgi:hypothetical protein